ncbi:hypothetical protein [Plasmodium yoelii yoelii]|uniref:Uncharacterized protein n=1 Tax=Plasmodium yoelii yoelii TaxID=73239 RepID=Q7REI3_PLAYO|nr:hypothetical protein [Plasmodium yoelii yoelii]
MFGVIHYQKNGITKKQSSNNETKPLTVPRENTNTISDNKSTSSTIKIKINHDLFFIPNNITSYCLLQIVS